MTNSPLRAQQRITCASGGAAVLGLREGVGTGVVIGIAPVVCVKFTWCDVTGVPMPPLLIGQETRGGRGGWEAECWREEGRVLRAVCFVLL
ncbi:MAG: hypothetical protein WDW36_003224 [Sanguina aurantia]